MCQRKGCSDSRTLNPLATAYGIAAYPMGLPRDWASSRSSLTIWAPCSGE